MNPSEILAAYRESLPKRKGHANPAAVDLTGRKFNNWEVVSLHLRQSGKSSLWNCRCSCGVERIVNYAALTLGRSKSCGCAKAAAMVERMRKKAMLHEWKGELRSLIEIARMENVSYPSLYWRFIRGTQDMLEAVAHCHEEGLEHREKAVSLGGSKKARAGWGRKKKPNLSK